MNCEEGTYGLMKTYSGLEVLLPPFIGHVDCDLTFFPSLNLPVGKMGVLASNSKNQMLSSHLLASAFLACLFGFSVYLGRFPLDGRDTGRRSGGDQQSRRGAF